MSRPPIGHSVKLSDVVVWDNSNADFALPDTFSPDSGPAKVRATLRVTELQPRHTEEAIRDIIIDSSAPDVGLVDDYSPDAGP